MCVQPMKSIAAVALSGDVENGGLDALSVTTAGVLTGAIVFFLGASNLMEVVNAIVPETVVVGIQVGVGLRLASKGMNDVMDLSWSGGYDCIALAVVCSVMSLFWLRENETKDEKIRANGDGQQASQINTDSSTDENVEMGQYNQASQESSLDLESSHSTAVLSSQTSQLAALESFVQDSDGSRDKPLDPPTTRSRQMQQLWTKACCCLHLSPSTPHPVGIYLFLIGCIFATVTLAKAGPDSSYDLPLRFFGAPIAINALRGVSLLDWRIGFFRGTLPQLPLTALNSVISVCCLAHQLYPEKRDVNANENSSDAVITRREVSISVGLMNLLLCPLGSMPNCHGAGGLAGQHRFGARHGTSVVVLGLFKVLLAIFFGGSALTLLDALPIAVLGVMVTIAGIELIGTGVSMLVSTVEKVKAKSTMKANTILREKTLVAMVTASVIIATSRTDYGALAGWVAHMIYGNGFANFVAWVRQREWKGCK
jgi:hypothetical protein